jgi:hypothetical protein
MESEEKQEQSNGNGKGIGLRVGRASAWHGSGIGVVARLMLD